MERPSDIPEENRLPAGFGRRIGAEAIRRGVFASVTGTLLPAFAAIICVRWMVQGLGVARFGVLTLCWAFVNSVGILDLGIGRTLTRIVAAHEESDARREGSLIWTALSTIAVLGCAAALVAWKSADLLATLFVAAAPDLVPETEAALRILSLSVPLVVLSSGFRGILEAVARFDLINRVTIPASLLNLIVPVILLRYGVGLPGLVSALVVVRLLATGSLAYQCSTTVDALRYPGFTRQGLRALAGYAGWITVSNVTSPFFAQAERFVLGAIVSPAAVAHFGTPADVLSRLTIIPASLLQVLFPVFVQSIEREPERAARIVKQASVVILLCTLPLSLIISALAPEGLAVWLGHDFAEHATVPTRLLTAAVFVNSMAWLPFSLVQGAGRADLTGKLHLVELPVHLGSVVALTAFWGTMGAALANLLRSTADGLIVGAMAGQLVPDGTKNIVRLWLLVGSGLGLMAAAALPIKLEYRLSIALVGALGVAWLGWFWYLDSDSRMALLSAMWRRKTSSAGKAQ